MRGKANVIQFTPPSLSWVFLKPVCSTGAFLWIFDTGYQNLKQEGRIGFEEPIVNALSVLCRGQRELVVVSRRKYLRGGEDDAPQSVSVHSKHCFL
jgi:hypothetical protein